MLRNVKARSSVVDGWKTIECLIINEVSQISSHVLETVDYLARSLRENNFPLGGIQLIMSEDFFQLPPVANPFDPGAFAFTSSIWELAAPNWTVLEEVVRQNETDFVSFLNRVAEGQCTKVQTVRSGEFES